MHWTVWWPNGGVRIWPDDQISLCNGLRRRADMGWFESHAILKPHYVSDGMVSYNHLWSNLFFGGIYKSLSSLRPGEESHFTELLTPLLNWPNFDKCERIPKVQLVITFYHMLNFCHSTFNLTKLWQVWEKKRGPKVQTWKLWQLCGDLHPKSKNSLQFHWIMSREGGAVQVTTLEWAVVALSGDLILWPKQSLDIRVSHHAIPKPHKITL